MITARLLPVTGILLMLAAACTDDKSPGREISDIGDGDSGDGDSGDGDGDSGDGDNQPKGDGDSGDGDGDTADAGAEDGAEDSGTLRNGFPAVSDPSKNGPFTTAGAKTEGPDCEV